MCMRPYKRNVNMSSRVAELGELKTEYPSEYLKEFQDANHLLGNREALLNELNDKGYLFIRGLHNREEVLAARLEVLKYIKQSGEHKLKENVSIHDGILDQRCGRGCIPQMEGRNCISHNDAVLTVLEGPRPKEFFETLFGEVPRTFDYKWLRGINHSEYTGAHVDRVYMCRGSENLLTMWTPFDDIPVEMGTLAMNEASHRLSGFKHLQDTYGELDVEKSNLQGTGWFTINPTEITQFGGQWKTTDYKAGDAIIFTMRTVHMSTSNLTNKVRISCDTRWQPASEVADPRYVGDSFTQDKKFGILFDKDVEQTPGVTIAELKAKWGFQ